MSEQRNRTNEVFTAIQSAICSNLENDDTTFVFPTDVASFSWEEWTVTHTICKAVPEDRFTAWDKFKGSAIKITQKDKNAVPSLLRKIFAMQIIERNKEALKAGGDPVFKSIINPAFIEGSDSFSDWIAGILPSLASWKKKFDAADKSKRQNTFEDAENSDYGRLYTEYKSYLDTNNLFEPSWETADFSNSGKFIIFFPEILEDFADYKDILTAAQNIQLITLPPLTEDKTPELTLYSNARTEIRKTALAIRQLHDKDSIPWKDIALNVPDIETSRPYIERELQLYGIPFILRSGSPYTQNCAGRIFTEIKDCHDNNFSYSSVRALLTDGYIPWKEQAVNANLIREGYNRKCICSYKDTPDAQSSIDIWEKSLSAIQTGNKDERELNFYHSLKKSVVRFYSAKTFTEVQSAWFIFKETFLSEDDFSEEADLILGRCLSELEALIDIENTYEAHVASPYDFFIKELESKSYQKQQKTSGVSVFKYKVAGTACFPFQFVVNASQKQLSVQTYQLSFLNKEKRIALGLDDKDIASTAFIRLYNKTDACFSCSEKSFSGFEIPHSFFTVTEYTDEDSANDENDFIKEEISYLQSGGIFPQKITIEQKNAFTRWCSIQKEQKQYDISDVLRQNIDKVLKKQRGMHTVPVSQDKIHLTESDMNSFFPCPRSWIFSRILELKEDTLNANLMNPTDDGIIRHKVLELFMKKYQGKCLPATLEDGTLPDEDTVIKPLVSTCADEAILDFKDSPLVITVLQSEKGAFEAQMIDLLRTFCASPEAKQAGFGGYKVYAAEEWFNQEVPETDYYFSGKLDCILCSDSGDVTIIDYKLSNCPKPADCIIPPDEEPETAEITAFQMPMYVSLWNLKHSEVPVQNALYFTINKKDDKKQTHYIVKENAEKLENGKIHEVTITDFEPTLAGFRHYAAIFAQKITDGNIAVNSEEVKPYKDCAGCRYKTICRTCYDVAGSQL